MTSVRTGGAILIDQLLLHGASTAFCVPGESYLAALDALRDAADRLPLIVCRSEGGASAAAVGHARATGRPGILFVTRGPGALNASIGVHTAFQDSMPLIMFVGQVARGFRGREGFQEIDIAAVFGPLSKWATEITDARRIPETVRRAYQIATSGRPGPVVIGLPEDMLADLVDTPDAGAYSPTVSAPRTADMKGVAALLAEARDPVLIVGGGGWDPAASAGMREFAEREQLPVVSSFRCQDLLSNHSPAYIGELGFASPPHVLDAVVGSDLLLVIGARLGEVTTQGYRVPQAPSPAQRMVHIHADPDELGSVYEAAVQIAASPGPAVEALLEHCRGETAGRGQRLERLRAAYLADQSPGSATVNPQYAPVIAHLRDQIPSDSMIAMGAGNYTIWARRYHQYDVYPSEFGPTSGAMGFGLPAAIGAQLAFPGRRTVVFAGDGCFMMTSEELVTAVRYRLPIVVLVFTNGRYGTIRTHQDRAYPGRPYGTDLVNPDFAMLARAQGANGEVVDEADAFGPALQRALAADGPSLIELRLET